MEAPPPMVKPFATFCLENEAATVALAQKLAPQLKAGDIVLLEGELGAGKTSLARAMIRAMCGPATEVPSPTFTLMQLYDAPAFQIAHFDLYRLTEEVDILEIGWFEARGGLTLVEWPKRLGRLWPQEALTIKLTFDGNGRQAQLFGKWI